VDTLFYIDGNVVSNNPGCKKMQNTNGTIDDNTGTCAQCQYSVDESDLNHINLGPSRGDLLCDDCCVYSEYYGETIAICNATHTDYDEWILDSDVQDLYNGKNCHTSNAIELYNGEYAHNDDCDIFISIEDQYFIRGDDSFVCLYDNWYPIESGDIELIDGEYFLIDSKEWKEKKSLITENE
jgi:hypothetical protein